MSTGESVQFVRVANMTLSQGVTPHLILIHHTFHLHHTPYTVHLTPYTVHLTPYTLHLTPYTLHLLHLTPYTFLFLSANAFLLWCTRVDLCFSFQARLWTVSALWPWPLATPLTSCEGWGLCGLRWPIFVAHLAAFLSRILAGSSTNSFFLFSFSWQTNHIVSTHWCQCAIRLDAFYMENRKHTTVCCCFNMEPFQNPHIIHDNGMCIMLHDIYVIKYFLVTSSDERYPMAHITSNGDTQNRRGTPRMIWWETATRHEWEPDCGEV